MSEPRITYTPRPDATPESELDPLAAVYRYLLFETDASKRPPARRPQTRRRDLRMIAPHNESYRSDHRPTSLLRVCPEGIPEELKRRPQWVNFKVDQKPDGRLDKVPYTPGTKQKASTTDLMTWRTFEEALAGLEEFYGVGFVLCSADPYAGIDLDDCVDPETGQIELWALQIIEGLDSYTEFSPSGKGVHIFVESTIPSALKRKEIEIYDCKRFFTITGHVVEVARD